METGFIANALKKPTTIEATYKIITPMFIGDADLKATGISPQSFKGVLRFWWRALVWGRIRQSKANDADALKALHHEEALLFGSSADNPHAQGKDHKIYGKGKVAIKITQPERLSPKVTDWPANDQSSSAYLAYGITESGSKHRGNYEPHREALPEDNIFTVTLILDNDEQLQAQLITTLKTIGLFSGLGSRSRRALGAVQLTQLNGQDYRIADTADYQDKANSILSAFKTSQLAPYTAFSQDAEIAIASSLSNTARHAHAELGQRYKDFRGQSSTLRGAQKTVFGLPLKGVDEQARRGSPLFFHIVEYADGQFGYSVLYLPSSIFHTDNRHQKNAKYVLLEEFIQEVGAAQ